MTVTSYNRILEITALSFLDVMGVLSLRDFQTPVKVSRITVTPIRISMPEIGKKKLLTIAKSCIEYVCSLVISKSSSFFIPLCIELTGKLDKLQENNQCSVSEKHHSKTS